MSPERIDLGRPPEGLRAVRLVPGAGGLDRALEGLLAEARAEGASAERKRAAGALLKAAERLEAYRAEADGAAAHTAVELAVEIARHLLAVEIQAGRHDVERIVRDVLAASGVGRGECVVHLHPDDAAALAGVAFRAGTRLEPDVGVERGDVQVQTPSGLFVRDLSDALDEIGRRIMASLRTAR